MSEIIPTDPPAVPLSTEDIIQAVISTIDQAILDPTIDISQWKNRPLQRLVQLYRDLYNHNEILQQEVADLKDALQS